MQLKYSFKKEWSHFTRTLRIWGVIAAILGFAISNPMMFKFVSVVMNEVMPGFSDTSGSSDSSPYSQASILNILNLADHTSGNGSGSIFGEIDISDAMSMYNDAGLMFSVSLASFATYGLLIIMLILMSAAGGEQKKRAMIVPMCSGLEYNNYLLPKFIIYPLFTFGVSFVSALISGGLCNSMFEDNKITAVRLLLTALDMSVYMMFIVCVFLSLGLCTSRPGIMVPSIFLGQMLIESLLNGLGMLRYHPFALLGYVDSGMITSSEYAFEDELPSFITAIALSLVICVMMYFLALGVLKAKKINNQKEIEPEF